ncbi:ABC transporter ATP-binding protein [Polynucleobacter paneuropaeus]|nr:ABC transporter ATP-binding protein [Polynucleobacter paneuropaeus]
MRKIITKSSVSYRDIYKRVWGYLNTKRKTQLAGLVILMLVASCAEVLSIGAVLPLLGVLVSPARVLQLSETQFLIGFLGHITEEKFIFLVIVIFCITALIAGGMRFMLMLVQLRLSYSIGAEFSISLYDRILHQSYMVHIGRNSSEIVSGVISKTNQMVYGLLYPSVTLIASSLMVVMILTTLFVVNPYIALSALLGFGSIYGAVISFTKRRISMDGEIINREQTAVVKAVQEGIGAIRDILMTGNQSFYVKKYANSEIALRHSQSNVQVLGACPRFVIEALAMVLIALLALVLLRSVGGREMIIPTLGILAISAQRMLPLLQQAYSSWAQIQSSKSAVSSVLDILDEPKACDGQKTTVVPLSFKNNFRLSNVCFGYDEGSQLVLNGINLEIKKGDKLGVIGGTGCGKSTLLNIIMGLILPSQGVITVDGVEIDHVNRQSWQANIAHVPQDIFLIDGSIAENVAFGSNKDEINYSDVERALAGAKLDKVVLGLAKGYRTIVGERGVRLSGGQKQRIGIARALYQNAELIVFDEATSALDRATELDVMDSISLLKDSVTMLVVAHRLSTLKDCNKVIELNNGVVVKSGTYQEVVGA